MTATPDRSTIKLAVSTLAGNLRSNLTADPPTAARPFRRVEVAPTGADTYAHPYLGLTLLRMRPVGVSDNDKLIAVSMELRIVVDVIATDPHAAMLDPIGAVDDHLDSLIDSGLLEGIEGFDDREWILKYPPTSSGLRVATATATQSFVAKVERGRNREPAA